MSYDGRVVKYLTSKDYALKRDEVINARWIFRKSLRVAGVLTGAFVGCMAIDMNIKSANSNHTFGSLVNHYFATTILKGIGHFQEKRLQYDCYKATSVQEKILLQRLRANAATDYGKDHKFSEIKSAEMFRKSHPLTRYAHFQPYITRLHQGEQNVLTKDSPVILAVTSGTSGHSKLIPMIKKQQTNFMLQGVAVSYSVMRGKVPSTRNLQKDMKIMFTPKWQTSPANIPVGPNSSSPTTSKHMLAFYSTPKAGFEIPTEPEALYVHLLFALKDKKLGMIEANFASLVHTAFVALELNWRQLIDDIEYGRVNPDLNISEDIREKLNSLMEPDTARARMLKKEFEKGFDRIAKRIWPLLKIVVCVDTGTFELYGKELRQKYCNGVCLYSPLYAATEGLLGVNCDPWNKNRTYLLHPRSMFYEFIPIADTDKEQPETLLMGEVEQGGVYEMVISTVSGLWRYRFGDVVKIVDFNGQCPIVEFMYRQGQLLNVHGEKISEDVFYKTLVDTVSSWPNVSLVDYCCAESIMASEADRKGSAPYYMVFLELSEEKAGTLGTKQMCMLDQNLQESSYPYKSFRQKRGIGPMVIYVVKPGSFQELRKFMLENTTATANQFKVPRVLKRKDAVSFMIERSLCCYRT
ncbi:GH3 domain-containing protein [Lingula anatina]|uniref:GH3 domain-containing protein n=1 Tax=Lingula anatina TaxID=7574 RepID=A0A1S3J1E6_LINAN|nr:GH3 domain-containing protein [Lingula anatina]XP_013403629.1 GH3 domain-containing protein [Lingula anatina]|eukprot:XP_013403628.1 GH3 domain-containing protein [Lingula anatina]